MSLVNVLISVCTKVMNFTTYIYMYIMILVALSADFVAFKVHFQLKNVNL